MTLDSTAPPITSAQNEAAAITRHAITFASGFFSFLGAIAFLPADQVTKAVSLLQDAGTHLQALIGDVAGLVPIVIAGVGAFSAFRSKVAASLPGQLKSITSNPSVKIPPGNVIEVPPAVAAAVPSPQVVAPSVLPGTTVER